MVAGKGDQTTIKILINGSSSSDGDGDGGETFTATGLMVLERNWLEVYGKWEKWAASKVPLLAVGQSFTPTRLVRGR